MLPILPKKTHIRQIVLQNDLSAGDEVTRPPPPANEENLNITYSWKAFNSPVGRLRPGKHYMREPTVVVPVV